MRRHVLSVLLGPTLALLAAQPLYAQEPPCERPPSWLVRYAIHETPADSNSPVTFAFALSLNAAAGDCTATGWQIASIEIRQVDPNGGPDRVWTQVDPSVPGNDGLWWVSHADVANPQSSEFAVLPNLVGLATAADPIDADLRYHLIGAPHELPIPPNPPEFGVAGVLSHELVLVEAEQVIAFSVEEPVEVDPPPLP
jgi:hypothetical protein